MLAPDPLPTRRSLIGRLKNPDDARSWREVYDTYHRLIRAADRGVRVRILIDDVNLKDRDASIAALDAHPNIEIRLFNPSASRRI
jgi:phosphatidylserine/phosphatidylglycerophosphate/cardiolipin synthase-like enzyme